MLPDDGSPLPVWERPLIDLAQGRNAKAFHALRVSLLDLGLRYRHRAQLVASYNLMVVVVLLALCAIVAYTGGREVIASSEAVVLIMFTIVWVRSQ